MSLFTATFGFLALAAIALLSVDGVGALDRRAAAGAGDEAAVRGADAHARIPRQGRRSRHGRVARQEALARVRGRRQRLRGGLVALSVGVTLAALLRVLSPGSGAWAIGFIPGLVGCAIAVVAY